MNIEKQVEIMTKQLENFDTLLEKLTWLSLFDEDPAYTKEATNIIRGNLSQEFKDD